LSRASSHSARGGRGGGGRHHAALEPACRGEEAPEATPVVAFAREVLAPESPDVVGPEDALRGEAPRRQQLLGEVAEPARGPGLRRGTRISMRRAPHCPRQEIRRRRAEEGLSGLRAAAARGWRSGGDLRL